MPRAIPALPEPTEAGVARIPTVPLSALQLARATWQRFAHMWWFASRTDDEPDQAGRFDLAPLITTTTLARLRVWEGSLALNDPMADTTRRASRLPTELGTSTPYRRCHQWADARQASTSWTSSTPATEHARLRHARGMPDRLGALACHAACQDNTLGRGTVDAVRAAARDLLAVHGPLPPADLARRLAQAGHTLAEDPDALEDHLFPVTEPEWSPCELADGRLADPSSLLDGLVVTTRLTDADVAAGRPAYSPDLDPLGEWMTAAHWLPLVAGGALTLELPDTGEWELHGPAGWMPGTAGQLLVLRLVGARAETVTVEATTAAPADLADDGDLPDRLRATFDRARLLQFGIERADLVLELRVRYPRSLTRPHRPLGELIEAAGLANHGDWVLDADELDETGRPKEAPTELFADLTEHLVADHEMTSAQADAVVTVLVAATGLRAAPPADLDDWEHSVVQMARLLTGLRVTERHDPDNVGGRGDEADEDEALDLAAVVPHLAELLADDLVAQAVSHDVLEAASHAAGPLAVLTRRVARTTRDRAARSNAWWLHACALEYLDEDGVVTERILRRALEASDDLVAAAADLAWHLDDRGQAAAARSVLIEHGLGDTMWAQGLEAWARPGPTTAGRNDRCPCGSGRKHKVCCGPHNGWPLGDRAAWLFEKLTRFAGRPANIAISQTIAEAAGLDPADVVALPDDPVVASICLFEGGLLADFRQLRGPLLPADEEELLADWEQVVAGAYEVVDVDPGAGMTLLDLTTGKRREVIEHSGTRQVVPGAVLLTWVVTYPDGAWRLAMGASHIPLAHRASLLELLDTDPDADELAIWYGGLFAPPQLHTTDGDPLTMCRVTMTVPDPEAARGALAAVGRTTDGGPAVTLEHDDEADTFQLVTAGADGGSLVGTVRLADDGALTAEANSVPRIDRLVALVLDVVDGAEVVDDIRTPIMGLLNDLRDERDEERDDELNGDDDGIGPLLEPTGGEPSDDRRALEQALDAWMAQQEERWCDEPVPALAGLTPRQAADDPTRRRDLIALLDEFPAAASTPGPGRGMDPDRLRKLLDLDV